MKFSWIFIVLIFLITWNCQNQNPSTIKDNQSPFTLVYYAIPNCANCERVKATLSAIQQQYPETFKLVVMSTTSDEGKADLQMYQLGSHGLLIFKKDRLFRPVPGRF